MALSQGLYQKQLQKLSPQQIQLMKLLQVPTAQLEERIKKLKWMAVPMNTIIST